MQMSLRKHNNHSLTKVCTPSKLSMPSPAIGLSSTTGTRHCGNNSSKMQKWCRSLPRRGRISSRLSRMKMKHRLSEMSRKRTSQNSPPFPTRLFPLCLSFCPPLLPFTSSKLTNSMSCGTSPTPAWMKQRRPFPMLLMTTHSPSSLVLMELTLSFPQLSHNKSSMTQDKNLTFKQFTKAKPCCI